MDGAPWGLGRSPNRGLGTEPPVSHLRRSRTGSEGGPPPPQASFLRRSLPGICIGTYTGSILANLSILGGAEVIVSLIQGSSVELATLICAGIIMGYTMIGGLGATFYASYFNTAFIFIGMLIYCYKVYFSGGDGPVGTI